MMCWEEVTTIFSGILKAENVILSGKGKTGTEMLSAAEFILRDCRRRNLHKSIKMNLMK